MCDYDAPDVSSMREVTTRVTHRCVQCRLTYPVKTKMMRWGICWDGTARTLYVCKTCEWMSRQHEMSPFHICLTTAGDDEMDPTNPRWIEVRDALAAGREPDAEKFAVKYGVD